MKFYQAQFDKLNDELYDVDFIDELVTSPEEPGHAAQSQAAIQSVIGAVARVSKSSGSTSASAVASGGLTNSSAVESFIAVLPIY